MKAIAYDEHGDESVLRFAEQPMPKVGHYRVLVRVKAAGVNPLDYKLRNGVTGATAPDQRPINNGLDVYYPVVPGHDFAGVVESLHYTSRGFVPRDEVIGYLWLDYLHHGTYAEYVSAPVRSLARKPTNATWEQAAGLPAAGLTAYQALRTIKVAKGDTILVHGASGGVGSFGVQIARILGARVIGTASERNHEFLRELGAEPVLYGEGVLDRVRAIAPNGVDGIVDLFGSGSLSVLASLLARGKNAEQMVTITDRLHAADIGAHWHGIQPDSNDLSQLVDWVEQGKLTVHVTDVLPLADAAEAHRRVQQGHTRGKIVLTM